MKPRLSLAETDFIASTPKSPGEIVGVMKTEFRGHPLLSVRAWAGPNADGRYELLPHGLNAAGWLWRKALGIIEEAVHTWTIDHLPVSITKNWQQELRIARMEFKGSEVVHARAWKVTKYGDFPQSNGLSAPVPVWIRLLPHIHLALEDEEFDT
jgi:hypothetical protein